MLGKTHQSKVSSTRLVSAFRDKLERLHTRNAHRYSKDYYYIQYGKEIVTRYREAALKRFGKEMLYEKVNRFNKPA